MNLVQNRTVLVDTFGASEGAGLRLKQAALIVAGIALLAICAKIKVPVPGSPVAMSLGTFAVLTVGAAYGPRLGLATIMGYMILGMLGMDIFQNSTADLNGISYMMGGTGGYLVGYVLATVALGMLARAGWDRSAPKMAGAMLRINARRRQLLSLRSPFVSFLFEIFTSLSAPPSPLVSTATESTCPSPVVSIASPTLISDKLVSFFAS